MIVSQSTLISAFSNGKFPNGQDFQNLIDSCYNSVSATAVTDTIIVSLFPSGSAVLQFENGILVQVQT